MCRPRIDHDGLSALYDRIKGNADALAAEGLQFDERERLLTHSARWTLYIPGWIHGRLRRCF